MHTNNVHDKRLSIPSDYREEDELKDLHNTEDVVKLRSVLQPEEKVYRLVVCMNAVSDGVLAATDRRILFCDQQFLSSTVVEFLYSEVAAVLSQAELLTTKISLVGIDKALYLDGIDKEHADRLLQFLENNIGQDYEATGENNRHFKHIGELLTTDDISGDTVPVDSDTLINLE